MAWSGVGIGDILSVTKLAWDLYHNCFLVAREAPDEFRQLVNELGSLQSVLRTLRDDVNSDKQFLDRMGEQKRQTLQRCLAGLFDTLRKLEKLVIKYRELGTRDGLQFWRKIKWVTEQKDISTLRAKIMLHSCNLSLCMTAIGNSSLARIERISIAALNRQPSGQENENTADESMEAITPSTTVDQPEVPVGSAANAQDLSRRLADFKMMERGPADSASSLSGDDGPYSFPITAKKRSPLSNKTRMGSGSNVVDLKGVPPSPRQSVDSREGQKTIIPDNLSMEMAVDVQSELGKNALEEVVEEAMKELSKVRYREQKSRPLRIVPQSSVHKPDEMLKKEFENLTSDELKIRRLNARDWLRVATWWLLKAKSGLERCEQILTTNNRPSSSPSHDSAPSSSQAYVDLLKASWILYDIVLTNEDFTSSLQTDENRKLFLYLSDAINENWSLFRFTEVPDKTMIYRQDLSIWERLQPGEELAGFDSVLPVLENDKWITVEQDDAGNEDERVLFRTFVNAEIGAKALRMKSKGAPYLLLVSTKEGHSEPIVTLCNQSGSLNLSRDLTPKDLVDAPNKIGMQPVAVPLNFDQSRVSLSFTTSADLDRFMYIPREYFRAVKRREPRELIDATETLIFRSALEMYETLKASTMKPWNPRRVWNSCDLRVLETSGREGWRTTRRLVISSSAAERDPWCVEIFLPMSRVQVQRQSGSRQVVARWSDCAQEVIRSDGKYHNIYSYVYDDMAPNIGIDIHFSSEMDAEAFERVVLSLNRSPTKESILGEEKRAVHEIYDLEPKPMHYKALMITYNNLTWKYSELYYMYADTDYRYDHSKLNLHLDKVYRVNYVSTHIEKLYQPPKDQRPSFSHCERKITHIKIQFNDEADAMTFMGALTYRHELLFSRRVRWIKAKPRSRFGSSKSNKGAAEVQIWRKANQLCVASRWGDHVTDKWMTMIVPRNARSFRDHRDSDQAVLQQVEFRRGSQIDMSNLVARDPKDPAQLNKTSPVTIVFETVRDCDEFVAILEGSPLPPRGNPTHMEGLLGNGIAWTTNF
ncbi:hypothetical protein L228DRAFT_157664 [Xylona heveae TC161]|uniref:Fungal N-terminal domain-containing protein n=1 Tax=Xylona heveae (strain CBS 132557 / TC161) TaxID=1328760 RepID=A0A165G2X9_XYLHT|nr:hypothetical protein L228DRAFT_157664 [Xylona heveae TC161]KZF21678.1 hypothetical protein L228DRAFT_157664 [Xylona heveae TC161]